MSGFGNYFATHRKAFVSAALGGSAAVIAALAAGSPWQGMVVAFVAGALGVGVPTGAVGNKKAKAA
jgi:hypothetical protein